MSSLSWFGNGAIAAPQDGSSSREAVRSEDFERYLPTGPRSCEKVQFQSALCNAFFRCLKVFIDIRLVRGPEPIRAPSRLLIASSPERLHVQDKGLEIADDGMEITSRRRWRLPNSKRNCIGARRYPSAARVAVGGDGNACLRARLHARITRSRQTACRATTVPLRKTSPRRRTQDAGVKSPHSGSTQVRIRTRPANTR